MIEGWQWTINFTLYDSVLRFCLSIFIMIVTSIAVEDKNMTDNTRSIFANVFYWILGIDGLFGLVFPGFFYYAMIISASGEYGFLAVMFAMVGIILAIIKLAMFIAEVSFAVNTIKGAMNYNVKKIYYVAVPPQTQNIEVCTQKEEIVEESVPKADTGDVIYPTLNQGFQYIVPPQLFY